MRIMKVKDKTIGNTTYYKYRINLPKEAVEQLKLLDKELLVEIKKDKTLIIRKKSI